MIKLQKPGKGDRLHLRQKVNQAAELKRTEPRPELEASPLEIKASKVTLLY